MRETLTEMLASIEKALTQQNRQAPELFADGLTTAARLALIAVLLFAAVLLAQLIYTLCKRQLRRAAILGVTLALAAGVAAWAYWPAPILVQASEVYSVQLLTRVPGKAEQEVRLSKSQQETLLALLQDAKCMRSFSDSLPYTGYGQTFCIFLQTQAGEVRVLAAPDSGCRYTSEQNALIYTIADYGAFYEALGVLAPL